jgi:DNA-binding response OmpR family regulator
LALLCDADYRTEVDVTEDPPSILVVEDDGEVRDTICSILTGTGFRVETAATAWEAIAVLDEKPFDLIVADIRLPGGLNGLQMAQHARNRHPTLRCLFISGQGEPIVCNPELDDFVSKPFRSSELIGSVWKVLRGNLPYPRLAIAR